MFRYLMIIIIFSSSFLGCESSENTSNCYEDIIEVEVNDSILEIETDENFFIVEVDFSLTCQEAIDSSNFGAISYCFREASKCRRYYVEIPAVVTEKLVFVEFEEGLTIEEAF